MEENFKSVKLGHSIANFGIDLSFLMELHVSS